MKIIINKYTWPMGLDANSNPTEIYGYWTQQKVLYTLDKQCTRSKYTLMDKNTPIKYK